MTASGTQRSSSAEGSVPNRVILKQHKYDLKTKLTPQERINLGMGEEVRCANCGKVISFGIYMSKNNYQYKRQVNGKVRYYCKYSCQTVDEKKDPPDKRRKWNKHG